MHVQGPKVLIPLAKQLHKRVNILHHVGREDDPNEEWRPFVVSM